MEPLVRDKYEVIGPYSGAKAYGSLDGRTRIAKRIKALQADLLDGIDDPPKALIIITAGLAVRLHRSEILSQEILLHPENAATLEKHLASNLAAISREIRQLGLVKKPNRPASALTQYLKERETA